MKRKESSDLGLLFTIIIAINLAVYLLAIGFGYLFGTAFPWGLSVILCEAGVLVPCIIYVRKHGERFADVVRVKKVKVSTIFKTILLTAMAIPVYITANLISQLFVPNVMLQSADNMYANGAMLPVIMTVLVAPIVEELALRGVFMNRYKNVTSVLKAALFTSLLFGILHLNVNQMCYAFVLGVYFALVNEASGSTLTSILMHLLVNAFGTALTVVQMAAAWAGIGACSKAPSLINKRVAAR